MTTDTSLKITQYLKEKGQATAAEMVEYLGISRQALFKQLAKLQKNNEIYKVGRPPKVFYYKTDKTISGTSSIQRTTGQVISGNTSIVADKNYDALDDKTIKIIDDNFLLITPAGVKMQGVEAFAFWCEKNKLPLAKTAIEYLQTLEKYNHYRRPDGLIDGTEKIKNTFKDSCLDKLYYLDFYSIERFGKTKLGQLLLYAKQSQNRQIIKELISDIKEKINKFAADENFDGVAYIPPTVKRETQFIKELEKQLNLPLRKIKIDKIKTEIAVPQKTLNKLEDRVENAKKTFVVENTGTYKKILLIDDAVGSGATFNEIACKIRRAGICSGKIIGLSITGSVKGFDVISEV
jgi:hypoxanthine-guanine phosphoribosyltransferase